MTHPMWNNELMWAHRRIEALEAEKADLLAMLQRIEREMLGSLGVWSDLHADVLSVIEKAQATVNADSGNQER